MAPAPAAIFSAPHSWQSQCYIPEKQISPMATTMSTLEQPVENESSVATCQLCMRHYRPSDYPALREIWIASDLKLDDTSSAENISQQIEHGRLVVIVVEAQLNQEDGVFENAWQLAGGVIVAFDGRRAYVYHLGVSAAFRGMKLGQELLDACEDQARAWGARHLRLTVRNDPSRSAAKKLYRRNGWQCDAGAAIYQKEL
jgi:ribosomal protein S18 acetylase RimI-like enzyme